MRIVFIDLHCINFLVRPYSQIRDGSKIATYKHRYILEYAIKNNIEVLSFITGKESQVRGIAARLYRKINPKAFCKKEFNYVIKNSYDYAIPVKAITDKNEIFSDDIVIAYMYNERQLKTIKELPGKKIVMGNHFVAINEPVNFANIGVCAFVNEIDLEDNPFVKKYIISKDMKFITAPYIYAERFVNRNNKRKNKAMAIGTLSTCAGNSGYKLYREYTGTEWIQPLRKMIFDQPNYMPEQLDSYISYIYEDKIIINSDDSFLIKCYKKYKNNHIGWNQNKYMSFDMVEKFNEYAMFICPEELIGMPGIGFVEGMACGAAYIGLDTSYYRKLGLIPNENYITYDGTMESLKKVIVYYQNHPKELNDIAQKGEKFVRNHFNENAVAESLFKHLLEL